MGSYLSQPITTKTTESGAGGGTQYGVASMQGWRKTQEDAHLAVAGFGNSVHRHSSLFGVFDGHGGPEVAKFCARHLFEELQLQDDFQKGDFEASLAQSFHRMDDMLRDASNTDEIENLKHRNSDGDGDDGPVSGGPAEALELLRKMFQVKRLEDNKDGGWNQDGDNAAYQEFANGAKVGCTAVVAFKHQRSLYVASAGDSRCVLSRAGKAIALSEDHKPSQEREKSRIIAAGGFLSDIGSVCRVNGNLNLSRAIGDLQYKGNPHLSKKEQIITAEPDVTVWELTEEDEFLVLACDGVWDVKGNQEVVDFVRQRLLEEGQEPTEVVCALLDACLATDPKEAKGIGCDNMTCIIAKLEV